MITNDERSNTLTARLGSAPVWLAKDLIRLIDKEWLDAEVFFANAAGPRRCQALEFTRDVTGRKILVLHAHDHMPE